jgi:hypothetical protein
MLIQFERGGPLDGDVREVSDECTTYYDTFNEESQTWHRYGEVYIPRTYPVTYEYLGERPDAEWWHK